MKVSELIKDLQKFKAEKGDVELVVEDGDGKSTWTAKLAGVNIRYTEQWYDKVKRWRIKLNGGY